jgi:hypothetical protein
MSKRSGVDIRIDSIHSRAICDEIGDRLREILRRAAPELPARLQYLIERFAETDNDLSPSIVPSLEDAMVRCEPISSHRENVQAYADLAD